MLAEARPAPIDDQDRGEPPLAASIGFAGLTFAYEGREPALRDVTFDVRPGEMVAVVGPTGSGKSTLGLLLARLWEPPAGTVFVGGRDVTTLSFRRLRSAQSWVPQDAFLFSRSLADNMMLGARVDHAAGRARRAVAAGIDAEVTGFARASTP